MGRGRQKAKHMKVARKLKYFSPDTDLTALQRELGGSEDSAVVDVSDDSDDESKYWDDDVPSAGWSYSQWDEEEED